MMVVLGYQAEVKKEENTLDEVNVIVATPFGVVEIPIAEYIIEFCDSVEEIMKVMLESAQAITKMQLKHNFEVPVNF